MSQKIGYGKGKSFGEEIGSTGVNDATVKKHHVDNDLTTPPNIINPEPPKVVDPTPPIYPVHDPKQNEPKPINNRITNAATSAHLNAMALGVNDNGLSGHFIFGQSEHGNNKVTATGAAVSYNNSVNHGDWTFKGGLSAAAMGSSSNGDTRPVISIGAQGAVFRKVGENTDIYARAAVAKNFNNHKHDADLQGEGAVGLTHRNGNLTFNAEGGVTAFKNGEGQSAVKPMAGIGVSWKFDGNGKNSDDDSFLLRNRDVSFQTGTRYNGGGGLNTVASAIGINFVNTQEIKEKANPEMPTNLMAQPEPRILSTISLSSDTLFDFNKSSLKSVAGIDRTMDRLMAGKLIDGTSVADLLKDKNSGYTIRVEGNTDSFGSDSHNKKLSQNRADQVAKHIKEYTGLSNVESIGNGESKAQTDDVKRMEMLKSGGREKTISDVASDRNVTVQILDPNGQPVRIVEQDLTQDFNLINKKALNELMENKEELEQAVRNYMKQTM